MPTPVGQMQAPLGQMIPNISAPIQDTTPAVPEQSMVDTLQQEFQQPPSGP